MRKTKLSEIAEITMGQSPSGEFCGENVRGLPLLNGPAEFTQYFPIPVQYTSDPKKRAKKGDILFCVRGSTTGRMNWADKDYAIGRGLASIRHKKDSEYNHFLKYLLENSLKSLLNNTNGSTFPNLTSELLANFAINIPEILLQKKISSFLRKIDQKIELNNRINAELEAMAKTLYDYWFVQFDFPDEKGRPYKSSGGKMVYNKVLKRKIPEGWEVKKLGECLKVTLGGTPSTSIDSYWDNGNIPWLSSSETANFPVLDAEKYITASGLENSASVFLPKGSVVVSIVRYIRPSILGIDATANQSVAGILETKEFKSSYIYFSVSSDVPRLMSLRTGAQQPHINKETIETSAFLVPSKLILSEFYKKVDPVFLKIIKSANEAKKFSELRDWLLPMLMNGQVKVG